MLCLWLWLSLGGLQAAGRLTGEAPWLVQVWPPPQAAPSSCLGSGGPESTAFPVEGAEQDRVEKGPGQDPLHSLEARFVFYFRFLLNTLDGRAWVATGGTGSRAGLGSLGG